MPVLVVVLEEVKLPPHPLAYETPTSSKIRPRKRKKFLRGDFLLPTHPIRASKGRPRNAAMETALDRLNSAVVALEGEMVTATVVVPREVIGMPAAGMLLVQVIPGFLSGGPATPLTRGTTVPQATDLNVSDDVTENV